jgi:hypothetical protein
MRRHERLLEERRKDDARLLDPSPQERDVDLGTRRGAVVCQVSATNTAGTTTASSPAFHGR